MIFLLTLRIETMIMDLKIDPMYHHENNNILDRLHILEGFLIVYKHLDKIIEILNQYPQIINQKNISIVISGNRPDPKEYEYYPDFIPHFLFYNRIC